jgi:adenosylcobinamide kinase/adenosylcobinamide-phosphate guanylyltransferase
MAAMSNVVFVTGGTRSGKSSFALESASSIAGRKVFVATAQAFDTEMEERIKKHREERGSEWDTLEESLDLASAVRRASQTHDVAVIDCLTLWVSNLMGAGVAVESAQDAFIEGLRALREGMHIFIVSNEVGMGIVPENAMARQFRDLAGRLNQKVAKVASSVFLVVAGVPLKIK